MVGSLPLSLILREALQPSRQVNFDVSDSDIANVSLGHAEKRTWKTQVAI